MAATLVLTGVDARKRARGWITTAPRNTVVTFKKPGRTTPQNDRMWAMLTDVARQTDHNGRKYTPDQWKCLFMHACGHEVAFMEGLNGEPFPAGFRSSKLTKEQMSDLIEFMFSWAAEHDVQWTELVT